jgi:hypothetical protein
MMLATKPVLKNRIRAGRPIAADAMVWLWFHLAASQLLNP